MILIVYAPTALDLSSIEGGFVAPKIEVVYLCRTPSASIAGARPAAQKIDAHARRSRKYALLGDAA